MSQSQIPNVLSKLLPFNKKLGQAALLSSGAVFRCKCTGVSFWSRERPASA